MLTPREVACGHTTGGASAGGFVAIETRLRRRAVLTMGCATESTRVVRCRVVATDTHTYNANRPNTMETTPTSQPR